MRTLAYSAESADTLPEGLPVHQQTTDVVHRLDRSDALTDDGIVQICQRQRCSVKGVVRYETVNAAPFVVELTHCLLERSALDTDEVLRWHHYVGEEHLAEVDPGGHVLDGADNDAWSCHRHYELTESPIPAASGPADEVAEVRLGGEARPHLLTVHEPRRPNLLCRGPNGREIGARVGLAHANTPSGFPGENAGKVPLLLVSGPMFNKRRADLTVGEPRRPHGNARCQELLSEDEPFDLRATATAQRGRPRDPDPSLAR